MPPPEPPPEPPLESPPDRGPSGSFELPAGLDRAAAIAWRVLVIIAAAVVVVVALVRLRVVVLPAIVAVLAATALWRPARWLRDRRVPASAAALAVLLAAGIVLAGIAAFVGNEVIDQFSDIGDQFSGAVDDVEDWLVNGPLDLSRRDVSDGRQSIRDAFSDNSDAITDGAVSAGSVAAQVVVGLVLAVVLLFFILKDGDRVEAWLASQLGRSRSGDLVAVGAKVWRGLGGYLRGVSFTGLVDGVIIGIGLAILGVPLAVPLAVLTFFGAFIPLVGATVAGVLAGAVALVSNGFGAAVAVGVLVLVVQQVEGNVLAPYVLGRTVQLHPVTILLALTAGSVLAGIVGAFLAVPVATSAKTIINHYRALPGESEVPSEPEMPGDPDRSGNARVTDVADQA